MALPRELFREISGYIPRETYGRLATLDPRAITVRPNICCSDVSGRELAGYLFNQLAEYRELRPVTTSFTYPDLPVDGGVIYPESILVQQNGQRYLLTANQDLTGWHYRGYDLIAGASSTSGLLTSVQQAAGMLQGAQPSLPWSIDERGKGPEIVHEIFRNRISCRDIPGIIGRCFLAWYERRILEFNAPEIRHWSEILYPVSHIAQPLAYPEGEDALTTEEDLRIEASNEEYRMQLRKQWADTISQVRGNPLFVQRVSRMTPEGRAYIEELVTENGRAMLVQSATTMLHMIPDAYIRD